MVDPVTKKIHLAYKNMRSRCENPRHVGYKNYGGRGITVCQEWIDSRDARRADVQEPPMTADELHAAVDETDTRGLTGFVLLTFHEPDGMRVGASVEDMETVALALRQALLAVESAQRGVMN